MASNSFVLKGWSVTVLGILLTFASENTGSHYILISFPILFFFWVLDGYYLYQEKLFRELYDFIATIKEKDINFSMKTEPFQKKVDFFKCLFSMTISLFYGCLLLVNGFIMNYVT